LALAARDIARLDERMSGRTQVLYHLADELRGIARLGLAYAQNDHDRDRYERVLAASARIVSAVEACRDGKADRDEGSRGDGRADPGAEERSLPHPHSQADSDYVLEVFRENLAHISPVAGAEAVVVRDGRLLLHRRADNGLWAMCGGLAEIGETLAEAAARELWEEARMRGRITRLLGVFDSLRWDMRTKVQLYAAVFEAESDDAPQPTPEATELGFFGPDDLPPLSPSHRLRVPVVFQLLRGERPIPYFDAPR
jgi:ADP-ribose pyrophosphatase YjhB (NUDIX family)